jgi:hypothetical protein
MEQTKVTDQNRSDFFKATHVVQTFHKNDLINIAAFGSKKVIAIDSCGWHYENHFFKIIKFEHLQTVKEYNLDRSMFDKLFNNLETINEQTDVLLLDHCPNLFKYSTEIELKNILETLTSNTNPKHCLVRMSCVTLGDNRLTDRFKNLCSIIPDNYIVEQLSFDKNLLSFRLLKKQHGFD